MINKLAPAFQNIVVAQTWHTPAFASFPSAHAGMKPLETAEMPCSTQVLWPDQCARGAPAWTQMIEPGVKRTQSSDVAA